MIPFYNICPDLAARETRTLIVGPNADLPPGEYAFIEFYCAEGGCDCRRVFLQVVSRERPQTVLASINFGWEKEGFYRRKLPFDPEAPRAITRGSLDPINEQSSYAPFLLRLFQDIVADAPYRLRLKRHYTQFKSRLPQDRKSLPNETRRPAK